MALALQSLRVPSGWEIHWNIFYETQLSQEAVDAGLFLDAHLLFWAVHSKRRFGISMEWRKEQKPLGQFYLSVLYAPRQLTPQGRQYKGSPLDFGPEPVYLFETESQSAMVTEIETWLERCVELVHGPIGA
jgi:hypothetical protein